MKPIDGDMITELASSHELLVTLEDGCIMGGAGSAVSEYLSANKLLLHTLHLGLPDSFIQQGTQQQMYAEHQIDGAGIEAQITAFLAR